MLGARENGPDRSQRLQSMYGNDQVFSQASQQSREYQWLFPWVAVQAQHSWRGRCHVLCTLENLYRASYAQRAASSGSKRQHFRRRTAVGSSDGLHNSHGQFTLDRISSPMFPTLLAWHFYIFHHIPTKSSGTVTIPKSKQEWWLGMMMMMMTTTWRDRDRRV